MKKLLICNFLKHFTGKFEISNVFPFEMYETFICNNEDEFSSLYKNYDKIILPYVKNKDDQNYLMSKYNIQKEVFISIDEYKSSENEHKDFCMFNFGEKNKDSIFWVMTTEPANGLFYSLNYFIRQIDYVQKKGFIPVVDMKYHKNLYLNDEEIGRINSWEYYFNQLSDYELEEVYDSANVIIASPVMSAFDYTGFNNITRCKIYQERIVCKKELTDQVDSFINKNMAGKDKVLGVICRGTDYANGYRPYNHPIPYDVYETIIEVKNFMFNNGYEYLYLSTEDQDVLDVFTDTFGKRLITYNQMRFSDNTDKKLVDIISSSNDTRTNNRYYLGSEYFTTIAILSHCDALIGSHCAGLRGAITLNNGRYEFVKVLTKGFYGMNGEHYITMERTGENLLDFADGFTLYEEDDLLIKRDKKGTLIVNGIVSERKDISICHQDNTYIPAGKYGYKYYGISGDINIMVTLRCSDGQSIKLCHSDKDIYLKSPVVAYDVTMSMRSGIKFIDREIGFKMSKFKLTGDYVKYHVSKTEIAIKSSDGAFLELGEGDFVDFEKSIIYKDNHEYIYHDNEIEKWHNSVIFTNGLVRYKYKDKYLDNSMRLCIT